MIDLPSNIVLAIDVVIFFSALTMALGAVVARRRNRRIPKPAGPHHVPHDPSASWTVDRALKALILACEREGKLVPGFVMVIVDVTSVHLHLASPTLHPALPWITSEDGLVWSCSLAAVQLEPIEARTVNTFTGLVTIGTSDDGRVLVDLAQARGLISIKGDKESQRAVARRWIDEFSFNPWSGATRVVLIGLEELATHGAATGTLDDLLRDVETDAPGVAFLRETPIGKRAAGLARALESPDCAWPVVTLGRARNARWKFRAHRNGWVTSDFLPPVRSNEVVSPQPQVRRLR